MSDQPSFLIPNAKLEIAKQNTEAQVEPLELGARVRELRLSQQLTLEEVSQLTGLARSTLSKIENEQISPTFTVVNKLASGLNIDIPQLFTQPVKESHHCSGRRDITRQGEGKPHPTATYEHELLAATLTRKKMIPFKTTVRTHSWDEYEDWVRHDGEEFLYVLKGSIMFYTEFYEPVELFEGDSAYYDCEMGHALISTSAEDAEVLWVTA
ncbi:XRE family transcriptional regulator [uncultured Neptuniibacter sp.]|uniref:helix-turn-helix domain-containing protein n=1 Tax=uncultured Neptuniibacter sp. TaxID=502143 RepID=UPI0026373BB5|nr:XRE family transcriptional regulator [uncultured Neptuniibacter sp.]